MSTSTRDYHEQLPPPLRSQDFFADAAFRRGDTHGKIVKVGDKHDAYLAAASSDKAHKDVAIVLLPDVIGIWKNSELIADQYAANGYTTIVLDTFNGDALPLDRPHGFNFEEWKGKHPPEKTDPIVEAAIKYLKSEHGAKRIGAVGYCWGAKVWLLRWSWSIC
jgi:dienelactone hydrolase